ncbi:MAG: bestrophin family ion channel [Bacteroidota bacterium]
MIVRKNYTIASILRSSAHHFVWLIPWASAVPLLYHTVGWNWLSIPWLPMAVVGTAVAFYVGFKNNSAYERMWEARKIWGAIVNSSRAWGSTVKGFVSNQFRDQNATEEELHQVRQRLIYRHIGWLYTLRKQLLVVQPWEHANQNGPVGRLAARYQDNFGVGLVEKEAAESDLKNFISAEENANLTQRKNTATQLIDRQSEDLQGLRSQDLIDDFRHMELQKILNDFYVHQGKCERIKKFPLPRQYANMSYIFIWIFIFLMPFGLVAEFAELGNLGRWLTIPFTVLLGWVFVMMELVGDYSENPFQGMAHDIPMLSLSRTIEIDLREMLGETDLPEPIQAKGNVLM